MASRLYLTNAAAGYTPTTKRGAWDSSATSLARQLGPAPAGTAATAGVAETSSTNNFDVLLGRWISEPVDRAGELSGTAEWIMGALESNASANDMWHVHIFATAGDSNTVRGTLLADSIGTTEWPTTATARGEGAKTLTDVDLQVGDRVVVEIGYQAQNTSTTSYTGTVNYGNTGTTDLANGGTGVTTAPGWVEFSDPAGVLPHHVQTLFDNFTDNSIDAVKWPFFSGAATAVETGQQLQVTALAAGAFGYLESVAQYSIANSQAAVYMAPPSIQDSVDYANCRLTFYDVTPGSGATFLTVYINPIQGTFGWYAQVNGVAQFDQGFLPTGPFAAVLAGGWFKVVESAGVLLLYATTDGTSWGDPIDIQPTPAAIRASDRLTVDLEAVRSVATSDGTPAVFDNVNLPPAGTAVSTTASLTAAAAVTGAVAATTTVSVVATANGGPVVNHATTATVATTVGASTGLAAAATTTAGLTAAATTNSVVIITTTPVVTATATVTSPTSATRTTTAAPTVTAATLNRLNVARSTTAAATTVANTSSPANAVRAITARATATATAPGVLTGYRAVVPVQTLSEDGVSLAYTSADIFNGNRFRNNGAQIVHLRNNGAATVTATFRYRTPQAALDGRRIVLTPGSRVTTSVWPRLDYTQTDGAVWVDFTSGTGVDMAVAEVYPAW